MKAGARPRQGREQKRLLSSPAAAKASVALIQDGGGGVSGLLPFSIMTATGPASLGAGVL